MALFGRALFLSIFTEISKISAKYQDSAAAYELVDSKNELKYSYKQMLFSKTSCFRKMLKLTNKA